MLYILSPVVTLPDKQTVIQLTAGFYKYMNVMDCVTTSIDDYVKISYKLATESTFRESIKLKILKHHDLLYEDKKSVEDWEIFLYNAYHSV